jgi:predicted nucleotidyltransferase
MKAVTTQPKRQYYAGKSPIRVPVSPELGEQIERQTEWYRLNTRSQRLAYIKRLCRQIAQTFQPNKIILFGSQAYGQPREDSDIDLLVVMPYTGSSREQALKVALSLNVMAPLELLVRTEEEIHQRMELGDQFIKEIVERGKVIYENDHARMG